MFPKQQKIKEANIKMNYCIIFPLDLKQIRYCNKIDVLGDFRIGRPLCRNITKTKRNKS